ncbi:DUF1983 domain-containing protein [Rhizobium skierniewicense]|uniref:phage tail tip fiber protein n=1 Tax=Rhizobium skierniewicense TaxID=984260 RepID=UPI001FAB8A23|nr:DUF1983 domain-containing protein [Rhizobium skierniewicense]MCI9865804.1 DUF1983 domain-containing protein [Rhizobium skierniewicense]
MAFISFITAAITAISAWAAAYPILAGFAVSAFSIAAQYAVNALFKPKTPSTAAQIEAEFGANIPRTAVLGTCGIAGHHIYRNNYGAGGRNFQDVFVLSSFRITAVPRVKYNGQWRTLSNPDANGWYWVPNEGSSGDNYDAIRVKFYKGTMDQQAEPELIAYSRPAGRWTANHRGAGVAYAVVWCELHKKGRGLTAPPQLLFEVQGAPLYDWRKDSTVGGSGSHRWNDQSTWTYSDNNFVQAYNLERGFFNGNQLMVGKGVRPSRLPLAEWALAANIADEIVDGYYRYRSHMIAKDGPGSNHDANLQPLLEAACASWVERVDGEFPIAGAPQAIVATITDDDIKVGAPKRFTAKRKRTELINTVAASYVSPDDFYETKDASTRIDQSALAEDRETLASSIPYSAVTNVKQVDRLADIAIRGARFQASAEITIHPRFLDVVKEGCWITWASAKHGTRTYQVLTRTLGPHNSDGVRDITIALQEISNGVFDPTAYATNPPVIVVVPPPDYLAEVQNFLATPNVVQAEGGGLLPGVRLSWDSIEDISVSGVLVEYWPVSNPGQVFTKLVDSDTSVVQIVEGLTSETDWRVRTTLVVDNGRSVAPSGVTNFRTLDAGGDFIADLEHLGQDVKDVFKVISTARDEFMQRLEQVGQAVTLEGAVSQVERDVMRVEVGKAYAEIETAKTVAANATEALAQQVTVISAGVAGNTAKIGVEETARINGDGALAQTVQGVSATFNGMFADGLVMFQATAAPAGVSVRFSIMLRANLSQAFIESGMYIQIRTVDGVLKSEIGFLADKFVVVDGANTYSVFAIEGGVVKIVNAKISMADIENLFVRGDQMEPGAMSIAKNQQIPAGGAGRTVDVTVNHGVNLADAHHESRIEIRGSATVGGSTSTSVVVTIDDLDTGQRILSTGGGVRGPSHPSGQQNASWGVFEYYSIPTGPRTSTTYRISFIGGPVSFSIQTFGVFIFKNVPNNV